jgi:hypothetical protein
VPLSALEQGKQPIALDYIAGQLSMVISNQDCLEQSNARVHKRLDDFVGEDYVKSEECERRCGAIEAKQGSVRPVVAFVWIPMLTEAVNLVFQYWSHVRYVISGLLKGG